jgi:hypothetical protein
LYCSGRTISYLLAPESADTNLGAATLVPLIDSFAGSNGQFCAAGGFSVAVEGSRVAEPKATKFSAAKFIAA